MTEPLTLPFKQSWKVLPSWRVLHRVAVIDEENHQDYNGPDATAYERLVSIRGRTCCGARGHLVMPGLFSRLGMARCAHCCRIAGVERGSGIPGNGDDAGPMDAWQVRS